jgi:hypothetical protein
MYFRFDDVIPSSDTESISVYLELQSVVFYNAQKTAAWAWSRAPIAAGNVRTSTGVNKETTHFSLYFALVFGHQCFGTFGMLPVTGITGENSIQFSNISLGFQMNCLLVGICCSSCSEHIFFDLKNGSRLSTGVSGLG